MFNAVLKALPNVVSAPTGRAALKLMKHSPNLMFAGGLAGVVTSTVLACKATLRIREVLDEHDMRMAVIRVASDRQDYGEAERQKDVGLVYIRSADQIARLYGPAVIIGLAGVCALTGSHVVLNRRNTSLTAAYAVLDKGFKEYRRRVTEEFGEEKDKALFRGYIDKEIVEEGPHGPEKRIIQVVDPKSEPSVYAKFFDEYCHNWNRNPEYNLIFLRAQQNYANDLLRARGHVFLNEVYDSLGIKRTKAGAVVGWIIDKKGTGDNFVDFGIFDNQSERARAFVNGEEPSILLDFNVAGVIYDLI